MNLRRHENRVMRTEYLRTERAGVANGGRYEALNISSLIFEAQRARERQSEREREREPCHKEREREYITIQQKLCKSRIRFPVVYFETSYRFFSNLAVVVTKTCRCTKTIKKLAPILG